MDEKSNEITAIPAFLQQLALEGCLVTIDAMGTQTAIAAQIIEQNGDYALALKENQGTLYEEVQDTFTLAQREQFAQIQHQFHETIEKGHGRLEIRNHWMIDDQECLNYLNEGGKWKGLRAIGMVVAQRRIGCLIWLFEKTTHGFVLATLLTIWGAPSPGSQSASTRKDRQNRDQSQTSQGRVE